MIRITLQQNNLYQQTFPANLEWLSFLISNHFLLFFLLPLHYSLLSPFHFSSIFIYHFALSFLSMFSSSFPLSLSIYHSLFFHSNFNLSLSITFFSLESFSFIISLLDFCQIVRKEDFFFPSNENLLFFFFISSPNLLSGQMTLDVRKIIQIPLFPNLMSLLQHCKEL